MRLPSAAEGLFQWPSLEQALHHVASTTLAAATTTLDRRQTTSTCTPSNGATSCGPLPADGTGRVQTVAIALGAGIPLGCAVVVLFFLHRRHLKKQRLEDMNDPHKSLDFGTGPSISRSGKKGGPEMILNGRKMQGLSMDMNSPYLLPRELNGSRASLRSMSQSVHDESDPYRHVALIKGDWESIRAPKRPGDNASVYSAAGSIHSQQENSSLVANARPMSQSFPNRAGSLATSAERKPVPPRKGSDPNKPLPQPVNSRSPSISRATSPQINLDDFVPPPPPPPPPKEEGTEEPSPAFVPPPRKSSIKQKASPIVHEPFPDALKSSNGAPLLPPINTTFVEDNFASSMGYTDHYDGHMSADMLNPHSQAQNRYSIMGLRPLPDNLPEDNPEQRANRIRSFYKEYFDESKGNPAGGYVDDYDADYLADYAIYDAAAGGIRPGRRPYAQPMGRRAMTPPPRGAGYGPRGPDRRPASSLSAAYGRGRAQSLPRKRLPPPSTLTSIPTPHLLKNDSAIFNAIEFAPPATFRDRQAGRAPDSPLGVARPYSPSVAAHSPLVASFDELASVPSPHLLRKSGTFTALDFARPPRFRENGTASDAGSIRSNRSGISTVQQNAIRQGAYRVSRIPTEMVGSREDIANQLKPRWEMRNGSNIMG